MTEPTDAEIISVAVSEGVRVRTGSAAIKFARAVLAKWGQPQTVAGEPVAYVEVSQSDSEVSMTWGPEPAGFGLPSGRHTLFTTTQTTQAQSGAVPLTPEQILELVGLAPDRKVCASTCMTAKFEKKPCECYPTSASRSEVVAIARAIEAAHGIKGGQHGSAA